MDVARARICGIPVDCVDPRTALARAAHLMTMGRPASIFAVNPEKVVQSGRNEKLKQALEASALLIPDGIGVVIAARMLGRHKLARVPGCELMPALCAMAAARGHSVFLFGAAPGVAEEAAAVLQRANPALRIAGCHHGYVKPEESDALIARINAAKPDILFVALGSPRQELWIAETLPRLDVRLCQAVGGTFDVLAGRVKRSPRFFRATNLEWFFRLASQPLRARRQSALPIFAGRVLKEYFTGGRGRRIAEGGPQ
jgi:N-acetylglucosaminyldiphosphoundecaprenol N-acetyl-beta-D-mannosaminyltransferase